VGSLSNPRHERFAQALAKGEPASAAYVTAGFKYNEGNAIRLKGNEKVQARVGELQERAAARVEITAAKIAEMLLEDREFARTCETPSAAVSATMGLAKLAGHLREKLELTGKDGGPLEYREAAEREIAELFGPTPIEVIPKRG
jgi:hypothetical protein